MCIMDAVWDMSDLVLGCNVRARVMCLCAPGAYVGLCLMRVQVKEDILEIEQIEQTHLEWLAFNFDLKASASLLELPWGLCLRLPQH